MIFSDSYTIGEEVVDLQNLRAEAKSSFLSAHATGTRNNLYIQWKAFFLFCTYYELLPLPCSLQTICLFAQFLSRSFKSVNSVINYLCGVKHLHLLLDLPFNHFDTFYYRLFIKGLKRCNPSSVKAALPITPDILIKIRTKLDFRDKNNYTFWCLFLFAFFLMSRKSNLVGTVQDKSKCLKRSDIDIFDKFLLVKICWSKTIQFYDRCLEIPIIKKENSLLCAYHAYMDMIREFPCVNASPAFIIKVDGRKKPVTYNMLQRKIKTAIASIGLDPSGFSSHSFRRGGATWAFQCGVPSELIQILGDWKSDAYKTYLNYNIFDKLLVSAKMARNM